MDFDSLVFNYFGQGFCEMPLGNHRKTKGRFGSKKAPATPKGKDKTRVAAKKRKLEKEIQWPRLR